MLTSGYINYHSCATAKERRYCGAWLAAEEALSDDFFSWELVLTLEADLLTRPERNYLELLTRYLMMVRDLSEAEFANAFRDSIRFMTLPELQDSYWQAFERNPGSSLRVGRPRLPLARHFDEIIAAMKAGPMSEMPEGIAEDHLVIMLRVMSRSNAASGEDMAQFALPAVSRIVSNMDQANPFRFLVQAVEQTLTPR